MTAQDFFKLPVAQQAKAVAAIDCKALYGVVVKPNPDGFKFAGLSRVGAAIGAAEDAYCVFTTNLKFEVANPHPWS